MQRSFSEVKYFIIDNISMVGRITFGQVDRCLRQAFHHHAQEVFRGCSYLLFERVDVGQWEVYKPSAWKLDAQLTYLYL